MSITGRHRDGTEIATFVHDKTWLWKNMTKSLRKELKQKGTIYVYGVFSDRAFLVYDVYTAGKYWGEGGLKTFEPIENQVIQRD